MEVVDGERRYKRVLLKVSGEALCDEGKLGLSFDKLRRMANEILEAHKIGTEICVVVGGGNFVRGSEMAATRQIGRATADYIGMIATVMNGLALQDTLESMGLETRLQTAIPMERVAEPFIRRKALSHLRKGRAVILAAGTGNPHFTTDTAAAQRAIELGCNVLLKATKVDGVYSADPMKDRNAVRYPRLTYDEVLARQLRVMDLTAISLCLDNNLPIIVFDLTKPGNITLAVQGKGAEIGTVIAGTPKASDR